MNVRSILTRGHWYQTATMKYTLVFAQVHKNVLEAFLWDGQKVSKQEVAFRSYKYDRITEKYYVQLNDEAYIQLKQIKPGEKRLHFRALESALSWVSEKLDPKRPLVKKQEIVHKSLASTKFYTPDTPLEEIPPYYLGRAVYLAFDQLSPNKK